MLPPFHLHVIRSFASMALRKVAYPRLALKHAEENVVSANVLVRILLAGYALLAVEAVMVLLLVGMPISHMSNKAALENTLVIQQRFHLCKIVALGKVRVGTLQSMTLTPLPVGVLEACHILVMVKVHARRQHTGGTELVRLIIHALELTHAIILEDMVGVLAILLILVTRPVHVAMLPNFMETLEI